jgi:hypothetical protein
MPETMNKGSWIGLALDLTSPNRRRAGRFVLLLAQRGTI